MSQRRFLLRAVDTWFFKDGQPFDAADEGMNEAASLFPPHPEVLIGALRVALARGKGWNPKLHKDWTQAKLGIEKVLGRSRSDPGELTFSEPMLYRHLDRLYPAPLHLAAAKEASKPFLLAPSCDRIFSDLGWVRHAQPPRTLAARPLEGQWLNANDFGLVLSGEPSASKGFAPDVLWDTEPRVGNARQRVSGTVQEGQLYAATRIRPKRHVRLGIEIGQLPSDWSPVHLQSLGGFQKLTDIEEMNEKAGWSEAKAPDLEQSRDGLWRYMIVLTGPCLPQRTPLSRLEAEESGWREVDGWLSGTDPSGRTVHLGPVVAACVGRPRMIGGWDSLKHGPVAMRAALPAGSVFFIEGTDAPPDEPLALGERTDFGYGHCRLGRWPKGWEESA